MIAVFLLHIINYNIKLKNSKKINVLYMARLHHKKGIIPLVEAWLKSNLLNNERYELIIAGPDDGELANLEKTLPNKTTVTNIRYLGAVYGEAKTKLLEQSSFFVLPSHSEGFPTSVLEAMQYGLVPLISSGCNFPEVFEKKLALKTEPNSGEIKTVLNNLSNYTASDLSSWAANCQTFVFENYSLNKIAEQQFNAFTKLIGT